MRRFVLVCLVLVGCSATPVEIPPKSAAEGNLDVALGLWSVAEPSAYRFTLQFFADQEGVQSEHDLVVKNGCIVPLPPGYSGERCSAPDSIMSGRPTKISERLLTDLTVTGLLVRIVQLTHDWNMPLQYYFHPKFGFPVEVRTNYGGIDGTQHNESGFRIIQFEILENDV